MSGCDFEKEGGVFGIGILELACIYISIYIIQIYIPGTQMTSIFEGQPSKTRPKLQSKQGSFGFQVYIFGLCIYLCLYI